MISLLVSAALVASAMASAAPSPAKPPPFAVRPGPGGGLVTAPDFPVEGRSALVAALRRGEPNLMLEAPDHILHVPSGVRLPRVLEGCRLGLVLPITPKGEKAASYQHGATAEYDCSPSDGLTQVEVSFETGFAPATGPRT
jgi:hypothetical protein